MKIKYFLLLLFVFLGITSVVQKSQAAELIGHWKLDETTQGATVIDSGTGGNNGTPGGTGGGPSPTSTVPSVNFTDPGSYYFNGNNQYVQIASSFTSAVSVTFWFNPLANGSGNGNDQWYSGTGLFDAEIAGVTNDFGVTWSGSAVEFGIGNPDVTIRSGTLTQNTWHHVAATWQKSDGAMKLYIDGSLVATSTGSTNNRISTNVRFGVLLSGVNAYYNGYMDDIRTYDVALDASQVQSMASGNSITLTSADNNTGRRIILNPDPITPASGSFKVELNGNNTSTDATTVNVSSNAGPDITNIRISTNEDMRNSVIYKYSNGMSWDLCWWQKPCALGTHYIYAQLMNQYGLLSPILSDSIELIAKPAPLPTTTTTPTSTPVQTVIPQAVSPTTEFKSITWDEIYQSQTKNKIQPTYKNVFLRGLKYGDIGEDVRNLQKFLNSQGFILTTELIGGAPGKETRNFLKLTYNALIKFQTYYQSQIGHAPNGIFDQPTINVANSLLQN